MKASPRCSGPAGTDAARPAGDRARRGDGPAAGGAVGREVAHRRGARGSATRATARDELDRISALARRTRLPLVRWHDLRLRASVAALFGRFDEALALNDEAEVVGRAELAQDISAAGHVGRLPLPVRAGHRCGDRPGHLSRAAAGARRRRADRAGQPGRGRTGGAPARGGAGALRAAAAPDGRSGLRRVGRRRGDARAAGRGVRGRRRGARPGRRPRRPAVDRGRRRRGLLLRVAGRPAGPARGGPGRVGRGGDPVRGGTGHRQPHRRPAGRGERPDRVRGRRCSPAVARRICRGPAS